MGSLRILSSIQKKEPTAKGMMYVNVEVARQHLETLVDTGASNLFMADRVAKKLGILVEKGKKTWLKTVNLKEVPPARIAKDLEIRIGHWTSHETVEVIPLDDYDFVIGLDFIDKINSLMVPFADCLWVLDSRCQCVVVVKCITGNAKILSAMQLTKGLRKGKATYIASLKVEDPVDEVTGIPPEVACILEDFRSVMALELPKE